MIERNLIIAIRCDSSVSIGSGHVMRCRALARSLKDNGARVSFICRKNEGDLISILQEEFSVIKLPELPIQPTCDSNNIRLKGKHLYSAWLGCTQEDDAEDCITIMKKFFPSGIDWLIVDHWALDATWEKIIKKRALSLQSQTLKLLVIDDLANRPHDSDMLLDQNFESDYALDRYKNFINPQCKCIYGPNYVLLNHEYSFLRSITPPRSSLNRILVFFGGSDPYNITEKVLCSLSVTKYSHLQVDLVVGSQNQSSRLISELAKNRPNTNVYQSLPSLAGLVIRADFALGACGSTTWERMCLGLPSAVISFGDDQHEIAEYLESKGCLKWVSKVENLTQEKIHNVVDDAISNFGACSSAILDIDGLGTQRVARALIDFPL